MRRTKDTEMKPGSIFLFALWFIILLAATDCSKSFIEIDPIKILLILFLFVLTRVAWVYNWSTLNRYCGLKHDYKVLLNATFVSGFADLLTPQMLPGAEIASSYYLKSRFGGKFTEYLVPVLSQSIIITTGQLMLLSITGFFISLRYARQNLALFFIMLILLIPALLLNKKTFQFISRVLFKKLTRLDDLLKQMAEIFGSGTLTLRLLLVCMLGLSIEALAVYILVGDSKPDILLILFAVFGSQFITLISMIPGGLGVYELSIYGMLNYLQIPMPELLSTIIIYRTVFLWFSVLIGGHIINTEIVTRIK